MPNAFTIPCNDGQTLTQVTGRFWRDEYTAAAPPRELLLRFDRTTVTLAVTDEDEISTVSRIPADDPETQELDLTDVAPWRGAIGLPVLWAWEMTNQQGYLDGVQLEFAENVESASVIVQMIALGGGLSVRVIPP